MTAPGATARCWRQAGAVVPDDLDPRHAPAAVALAGLAAGGAPEPVYVRRPDAEPRVA